MTAVATEKRILGVQLRDVETTDSLSMLKGRAVPYGVETDIGWFMESFAPGSLAKSIRESAAALPLLVFHQDRNMPIGAASEWIETNAGLEGVWRIDTDPDAQRAAKKAQDGFLNFMSIRFAPIRSEWTEAEDWNPSLGPEFKDKCVRTEARLIETSLVSTPAYNDATVEWVRTAETNRHVGTPMLDEWRAELERLRA